MTEGEEPEGQRWRDERGRGGGVGGAEEEGGVTHTTPTTWHQSMGSYPLYTQCTSPSSPSHTHQHTRGPHTHHPM